MICQFLQFITNPRFPQRKEIPSKIPIRNFTYFRDLPYPIEVTDCIVLGESYKEISILTFVKVLK